MGEPVQWWSRSELARVAGITVRALRHYDERGLLQASGRTAGGHRRYSDVDVARLFHILALRDLGLGLSDVAAVVDSRDSSSSLTRTVRAQREHVEQQLAQYQALLGRLEAVLANLEDGVEDDGDDSSYPTEQILDTLEAMAMTVHLTRIYTRRGDDGHTDLADRSRVAKVEARIEAIGAVDELNAALGLSLTAPELAAQHIAWLRQVQNDLFDIGAALAEPTADEAAGQVPASSGLASSCVAWLEQRCDAVNADLPALRSFVLPGGTSAAAYLHLARTVCRRAERRVLTVPGTDPIIVQYLNRLSDLLFILSRAANRGGDELLWQPGRRPA